MSQSVQNRTTDLLAEGALRNLHLDCALDGSPGKTISSRMLHYNGGDLIIADLSRRSSDVRVTPGDRLTCSCRLGSDIIRFAGEVVGRQMFQLNASKEVPALVVTDVGAPSLIHRRRYFRVSLARHTEADVTLWVIRPMADRSVVCGELRGVLTDLSGGGAGVNVDSNELLSDLAGKELLVRFLLPGENESLIFRAELRHQRRIEPSGMYNLGIEFVEYVDPGRHQRVIDDIVRYVSRQERTELKRRRGRRRAR